MRNKFYLLRFTTGRSIVNASRYPPLFHLFTNPQRYVLMLNCVLPTITSPLTLGVSCLSLPARLW